MPRRLATIAARTQNKNLLISFIDECRSWTLNTYDNCDYRCIYCVTGSQGASTPKLPREAVAETVRAQLERVPPGAPIQVGAIADAYPLVEDTHQVTRPALEELIRQKRTFNVITKGLGVRRDFDLVGASIGNTVVISICSHEDALLRRLDPRAPLFFERIALASDARAAGITVRISIAPWIPEVTHIEEIMKRVPRGIAALVAPLNVNVGLDYPILGQRYDQEQLNAMFLTERDRLSHRTDLCWYPTVNADGSIYVGE